MGLRRLSNQQVGGARWEGVMSPVIRAENGSSRRRRKVVELVGIPGRSRCQISARVGIGSLRLAEPITCEAAWVMRLCGGASIANQPWKGQSSPAKPCTHTPSFQGPTLGCCAPQPSATPRHQTTSAKHDLPPFLRFFEPQLCRPQHCSRASQAGHAPTAGSRRTWCACH